MSGAEAVIGLIAGVIGLLEAANKAYDTIKDISGLPKAFEEVSQRIPLVLQILEHAKANAGQAPGRTIDAITPVITACKREAEVLKDILVKLANGDSGWDQNKYVQMVKCKGKKARVEDLMKKIVENVQFLASDKTMKLATAQQLQELKLAMDGLKHVAPSAPDEISGRGDSVTINHGGNGPQNNHIDYSNSFTTWNNHGNGPMVQGNPNITYNGYPPDWHAERSSRLLWVSADPGCGKSVLARHLVDNVLPSSSSQTVCYFFFKDDFEDQKSAAGAMCAILHQIFTNKPFLISDKMLDNFERTGPKLFHSFSPLWDMLLSASFHHLAGEITCVLDALDECEEHSRIQIADSISLLFSNPARPGRLKFLLTSRMDGLMSRSFQKIESLVPTIRLHGEDEEEVTKIAKEINAVVKCKVDHLGKRFGLSEEETQRLSDELTSMPNRTYLWAYLVCDMIERSLGISLIAIQQIVEDIPSTVDEAYERILRRSTDFCKARTLLHIVVGAERPLSLQEMAVAFAIACGCEPQAWRPEPETRTRDAIRVLCGLFVTVVDSKVYLIHQTAKEFLQRSQSSENHTGKFDWKASCDPLRSNGVMADVCVKYLHFKAKSNSHFPPHLHYPADCKCEDDCAKDGFLAYSVEFWTGHIRGSNPSKDPKVEEHILDLCNAAWIGCLAWLEAYNKLLRPWKQLIPSGLTPLIVASYFGLDRIVRKLVQMDNVQLNVTNARCRSALAWAASNGHTKVVRELLNTQSSTTILQLVTGGRIDINSRDDYGQTPLELAAKEGHEAIVQLLLENGRIVVDSMSFFGTPLYVAAEHGHAAIVRRLLLTGKANVNSCRRLRHLWAETPSKTFRIMQTIPFLPFIAWDELFGECSDTPFIAAAIMGHIDTMKVFLEIGIPNINTRGDDDMTALAAAASFDEADAVKLLLEIPSIAVDSEDSSNKTPLALAAEAGNTEIVNLLLRSPRKPNVNHMCASGRTPLALASCAGYEDVVRALLKTDGVDANLGKTPSDTPLSLAAQEGHFKIIQVLLNSGKVDFNSVDSKRRTPLFLAARNGEPEVIQSLLKIGTVHANARGTIGRTPLFIAVEEAYVETLATLIREAKAGFDRKDSIGITSFLVTAESGKVEIIEFLLQNDAMDLQAILAMAQKPAWDETALHLAAKNGRASAVRLLLEAGSVHVDAVDHRGTTPFDLAKENGFHHVCEILADFRKRQDLGPVLVRSDAGANATWLSAGKQLGNQLYDRLFS